MSSQSLYRKWRSQTFGDLVGQEPVVRTLKNALSSGKLAHAYLFTGPRGTGKTSTARLLAKTINCANPINGEPCNQCQQCREITAGTSFNVIEIDAASNRGIDSIRDLREKVMMPPATGKYKVYVLDEAHMLTTEAFNALLKTLEEPPDYAIFVLATTDVHKMLPTVLSRCQRFDFKRITTRQIVEHLNFVAEQEHVKLERAAAELIARAAAGGMRDALSLLDQAIAYAGDEISLAQVQAMLGVADPRAVQKFITYIAALDSAAGLHLVHELSEAGADLRQVNTQIGEYWRALMLAKADADIAVILDLTEDEVRESMYMARLFTLDELTELARIFAQNDLMQKSQATPQLGLELALLQSIELHRRAQSGQPLAATSLPAMQAQPAQMRAPSQPQSNALLSHEEGKENGEQGFSLSPAPVAGKAMQEDTPAAAGGDGNQPALTLEQVRGAWERVKKRIKVRDSIGARTEAYLNRYTVVSVERAEDAFVVTIQTPHKLHYDYIHKGGHSADVEWALGLEFNQKFRVHVLAPSESISPGISSSSAEHVGMPSTPQQSGPRKQPASTTSQPAKSKRTEQEVSKEQAQESPSSLVEQAAGDQSPVAKKGIVRENTTGEDIALSSRPSIEVIKEKASQDPVVQEVMRMFSAKITDIRPL